MGAFLPFELTPRYFRTACHLVLTFSRYEEGFKNLPEELAFCIAQFTAPTEKCFRKLTDNLPNYNEFLRLPEVYKHFTTFVSNFKKTIGTRSLELKVHCS